jgi:hypothetical protein
VRIIPGFHAVRCVAPTPDGTLFVVGKVSGISGTALWEVEPGGRVNRCGPASPNFSHWIDVFTLSARPTMHDVVVRCTGFYGYWPAAPMPVLFDRCTPTHDWRSLSSAGRVWAGGRIFVARNSFRRVDLQVAAVGRETASTEYTLYGEAEHAVDPTGVTVLHSYQEEIRPVTRFGSYVSPGETRTEWRLYHLDHDAPLGAPRVVQFHPSSIACPASGGLLVAEVCPPSAPGRVFLVGADREAVELPGIDLRDERVFDAAPGRPTLGSRFASRRLSDKRSCLTVDGRQYRFTQGRNVVGARLSPDGMTAYAWTRQELIQFDL